MRNLIRAAIALALTVAIVAPANANSSSYTIDQVQNSPTTFTVNDMTDTLLASTTTAIQFRLNYTTLSLPGKVTITPGTISGSHNAFSPTNVKVSCSKVSGTGTLSGLSNVALTAGGVTCATMPTNSSGNNIIVKLTITIDDTALAPSAFGADTYTGSLTISGLDG
jgi:hypothetical protein